MDQLFAGMALLRAVVREEILVTCEEPLKVGKPGAEERERVFC
jgi:hypothetical protein